jgi:hypothetical protein
LIHAALILLERKSDVCEIEWLLNGCLDRNIKIGEGRLRGRIRHRTVVYNMQPRGKLGSWEASHLSNAGANPKDEKSLLDESKGVHVSGFQRSKIKHPPRPVLPQE